MVLKTKQKKNGQKFTHTQRETGTQTDTQIDMFVC